MQTAAKASVRSGTAAVLRPLRAGHRAALSLRQPHVPSGRNSFIVRSQTSTETTSIDVDKTVKDLQEKWDKVENKPQVIIYGSASIVTLWLANTIVSAVNSVPLLPKFFELIGLSYSAWFVYRYLLFKSSREELLSDIEELKQKIAGSDE